jgi:hypothetical protein
MNWVWVIVIIGTLLVILLTFLFLVGYGMAKMSDESNCAKLRRLGERGVYKE